MLDFLPVKGEKFKLPKFTRFFSKKYPLLMLMAGCHGEEPAPPLAIFENFRLILKAAEKSKVNLIIYPLVNPWGFGRRERMNRLGLNCNRNWCHKKISKVASEVKAISRDIMQYKPDVFFDLHEDDDTEKEFYIFSCADGRYDGLILKTGKKYFPILKNGDYKTHLKEKVYIPIKVNNGVVRKHHDGSAEDWQSHRKCRFVYCTETPSAQPLRRRIDCNRDIALRTIKITAMQSRR